MDFKGDQLVRKEDKHGTGKAIVNKSHG